MTRGTVTQGPLAAQKLVCKHLLHLMQRPSSNSGEVGRWIVWRGPEVIGNKIKQDQDREINPPQSSSSDPPA